MLAVRRTYMRQSSTYYNQFRANKNDSHKWKETENKMPLHLTWGGSIQSCQNTLFKVALSLSIFVKGNPRRRQRQWDESPVLCYCMISCGFIVCATRMPFKYSWIMHASNIRVENQIAFFLISDYKWILFATSNSRRVQRNEKTAADARWHWSSLIFCKCALAEKRIEVVEYERTDFFFHFRGQILVASKSNKLWPLGEWSEYSLYRMNREILCF